MPHDVMSELSIAPEDDIVAPPQSEGSSILSAMREAGRSMLSAVRRTGSKGILATMLVAGAAICAPHTASAQHVCTELGGIIYCDYNPGPESQGDPNNQLGGVTAGDPVNVATGNVFLHVTDYKTAGQNPLEFTRYYNSMAGAAMSGTPTFATTIGSNWRSNYDKYLQISPATSPTSVMAERADGQQIPFTLSGTTWVTDPNIDMTLTHSGSTWTLTDHNNTVDVFTDAGTGKGILSTTTLRNGYKQTMAYTSGLLHTVTDSYSRVLTMTYSGGLLQTLSTPDTPIFTYGFTAVPATSDYLLTSISYNTSPVTNQTYAYTDTVYHYALTSITDEIGNPSASWTYEPMYGRAATSQLGGIGANLTTFTINNDSTVTVTNAFGVADTYTFSEPFNSPVVSSISRAATATTAAASESFGYDANGFMNDFFDWNNNETSTVNDVHGDPTTINEAVGSSVARTTTISYDPTWVRLPHQIVTSGLTNTFVYDTKGNPLTRTDLDTTTNTIPYSTNGQSRVTTWTWSATGQETSERLPRTDVTAKTTWTYTGGTLTQISDPLAHLTKITSSTPGGYPKTIVDENSVTTTLAWDARMNLNTSTMATTAGNLVTTWTHDPANRLTAIQWPDNSKITIGYDTANRPTKLTDIPGNTINYTLDALGDRTLVQVKNTVFIGGGSVGQVTASHSATFDALGRTLTDVGGMSQSTSYTWDLNGNPLTITPPSPSGAITLTWDALNRIATRVDPSPGGTTTFTWDAHNRALNIQDANGNSTAYVNDGFSDRTQTTSPDSGTTVYTWDKDRNLSKVVLAGTLTRNATFDALDRPLTRTFPSDTTLNQAFTWDQATGHGFGIGRLTSATDKAGSLSNTFDERGNITSESRVITSVGTLATATAYDAASNISSITYPSGTVVTNTRNSMGLVTAITAKPPGASSASNVVTGVTYEPFGPETALTFGNGVTGTYGYDTDYRPTTRADKNGATSIMNLAYTYFTNNSVHTITDTVNTANTQTLGNDALDRLTSATSGTGGYGTWSWTWDAVNNVATQVVNGTTTTYTPVTGSNKLSTIVSGSTTENVVSTAAGNINTLKVGTTTLDTLTYNQANELATAATTSTSATYKYGFTGERLEKTVAGSNPVIFQYGQAARELLSENDLHSGQTADYIYLNGRPVGEVNPTTGSIYATHTERLGTPQKLTDSTKATAWSATYDPFGNTFAFSGTLTNQSLRLPGQYFDPETGMNHNGFRDYAGGLTRYVQSDPIGLAGGMNTYQYVGGNPIKFIDPKGLSPAGDFGRMPQPSPDRESLSDSILGNPVLRFVGDNPKIGWYLMGGGAGLLTGGALLDLGATVGDVLAESAGLAPEGVLPITGNGGPLEIGPASAYRPGWSLWDSTGTEYRYAAEDNWHNPHWDTNTWSQWNTPWRNTPIGDLPPVKLKP